MEQTPQAVAILTLTSDGHVAHSGITRETAPALLRILQQVQAQVTEIALAPVPNSNGTATEDENEETDNGKH